MKTSINKTKTTITIAMILLMTSVTLMNMPVQAQYTNMRDSGSVPLPAGVTPDATVDTTAYLSFRPNPVGVGQTILVNMWLTPATHATRYFKDYTVTITKPDGTKDVKTMNSYYADTTAWFEYVVDQVGTWKLKFEFPGGYFPAGNYTAPPGFYISTAAGQASFTQSVYYKPASTAEQTLTVQEEQVMSWPESPLPTDYWTRPVSPENREWWSMLGNYPWHGPGGGSNWPADTNTHWSAQYSFTPYVQAPNTAHIVWKRQGAIGGLMGGYMGKQSVEIARGGNPNIIYAGRCYETITKVVDGTPQSVWQCYDLRTGEVYWERKDVVAPTVIEYYSGMAIVPGAEAIFAGSHYLVGISGGRYLAYDPWSGAVVRNVSISPLTPGTYYMNGHYLSVQDLGAAAGANRYRLINWTITGDIDVSGALGNLRMLVKNNITWPWSSIGTTQDFGADIAAMTTGLTPPAVGAWFGTNIQAASLTTGALLWNITVDDTMYSRGCTVADHGKVAALMMGGYYKAWDLNSGKLVWKSEAMDYPWSQPAFGAYSVQSAYGLFYREAYDGVYAFDWDTGKIVWKYKAPAQNPYETPYIDETGQTVYSFNAGGIIADGKLYTYNTEHTATQPVTRGWRLHCINATTGEGIWNITGSMTPGAVADGYLTASNNNDGYKYIYGKGRSATTVTAAPKTIANGASVLIEGTVLDQSPAQPNTPCVSKESMTQWMEYLHMQKAIPADVKGVPVSLDAVDSNGNAIHIATVMSDMSGTFGCMWQPEITGKYTVTATFMGDDSYSSSWAETYVGVVEAPEATPTPEPPQAAPDSIPYIIGATVAIILAVAIATILILRKRS